MQMFVRVVEKGSFSAVAKERGIGQPAVSKQLSALENDLGTELIHRTSRSLALTEAGRDFYESALRILEDFESATSRIGRGQTAPKGLIRATVPPTFARLHMVSKLPAFFAAYPDMAVEMAASESPTTIIKDGFDLAIHSGDLPDSTLVARRFAQTMTILVATPQYLTRHGAPESPDDLSRFRAVVFCGAGLRAALELWLRSRRQARCPRRNLSHQRYRADADGCSGTSGDCAGAGVALRRRTQRRHRSATSCPLGTNRADPCRATRQPPDAHQGSHFHRASGEDVCALLSIQSTT